MSTVFPALHRFAVRGSRFARTDSLTVGRKMKREMVLLRVPPRRMPGIGVAEHAPASAEPVLAVFSPVVLPAELVPAVIAKVPLPERRVPACQSPVPMLAGKFRALFHGFRRRRNRFPFCRGAGSGAITGFFLAGTGFGWIAAHGSHGSARQRSRRRAEAQYYFNLNHAPKHDHPTQRLHP